MNREVTLVTRAGCHLCDNARETIAAVAAQYEFELAVLDVDSSPDLLAKYGDHVPVVLVDGSLVAYWFVTSEVLAKALAEGPESISVPPL